MIYNGFGTLNEAIDAHATWLADSNTGTRLNLRDADLSGAILSGAILSGADFSGAILRYAILSGADFSGADFSGAILRGAILRGADFSGAIFSGADFSGADFSGAILSYAIFSGADFSGADFSGADFSGANFSGAILRGGLKWERYLAELVPALLTAGGKTLEEVVTQAWDCHSWENCPMAVAFGVHKIADIPPLYQHEAAFFIQLFDAKQIPNPLAPKTEVTA